MTRRAFSLIELLMAIFILGIGLISIAALFPAGIALQQRAEDELNGPIVAAHAIEVIRGRLSAEDFGSWWDFHDAQVEYLDWRDGVGGGESHDANVVHKLFNDRFEQPAAWLTHETWPWLRPAMVVSVTDSDLVDAGAIKPGTLDIFNALGYKNQAETIGEHTLPTDHRYRRFLSFDVGQPPAQEPKIGIPFHPRHIITEDKDGIRLERPDISVPRVLITPDERTWPRADAMGRVPMYFWDCAFRRVGSDVQVAVFVYRAKRESLSQPPWVPAPVNLDDEAGDFIPVPWTVDLTAHGFSPWRVGAEAGPEDFLGTEVENFDSTNPDHGWMWPGQWLVDQVGDVHRIASGRTVSDEAMDNTADERHVSLSTPVSTPVAAFQLDRLQLDDDNYDDDPQIFTAGVILPPQSMSDMRREVDFPAGLVQEGVPVVDRLWYVSPTVTSEHGTYRLIPIHVTVASL